MRKLSDEEFLKQGNLPEDALKAVPMMKERAHTFHEAKEMLSGELAGVFSIPTLDKSVLLSKEPTEAPGATKSHLEALVGLLKGLPEDAGVDVIKEALMPYADEKGRGAVLWPLRYALSGAEKSPDPFTLISLMGIDASISRTTAAIAILEG